VLIFFGSIWVYFIFRFVLMCYFMNERAYRVCFLNGCDASYLFAFKCLFRVYPYYIIIFTISFLILVFGYLTQLFEPISFKDSLWLIVVSIFTIGYGELIPVDPFSRLLDFLCLLLGLYTTGLFVTNFWAQFS